MIERDVIVVGAGPAGLCAGIEASRAGADVLLIDDHAKAGGQLFKQIHKFFGSKKHGAGMRGFDIGAKLLKEADELGVELRLDTKVWALFRDLRIAILYHQRSIELQSQAVVLASGAMENAVSFPGWTLPGVMSAGAAQTMINVHRVLPGRRILLVGSGNVGLIVGYQLLQAGADVVAVVESLPKPSGYEVHVAKIRRAGVPILTLCTIVEAKGENEVESAVVAQVDEQMRPLHGSGRSFEVDTICLAVGLTPMVELALMAGCECAYFAALSGHVPLHDERMETSVPGVYVAGDVTGVEEANTAMEEGRLAGIAAAETLGYLSREQAAVRMEGCWQRLNDLRCGQFGEKRARAKTRQMRKDTPVAAHGASKQAERANDNGAVSLHDNTEPGATERSLEGRGSPSPGGHLAKGGVAIIECSQEIPCNPCEASCPRGAIRIGTPITNRPVLDENLCTGCGICIANCPGLAIFVLDMNYSSLEAAVSFPYEYLPLPQVGDEVPLVDRDGNFVTKGRVTSVQTSARFDRTAVVTVLVPKRCGMVVGGIAQKRRETANA